MRTRFGGVVRPGKPVVTMTLIGICVASFALQLMVPNNWWTNTLMFVPGWGPTEPWRFITVAFVHSTSFFGHLLFNMYALYLTGRFLEPALGRARFITLCLLSAVTGSVMVTLLSRPNLTMGGWWWGPPVVGASGIVFGLFGAMIPLLRKLGHDAYQVIGLLVINAVLGFMPGLNISWQGHLGGLLAGLALGYGFAHAPRAKHRLVAWALPAAVFVIFAAAALWKYQAEGWFQLLGWW